MVDRGGSDVGHLHHERSPYVSVPSRVRVAPRSLSFERRAGREDIAVGGSIADELYSDREYLSTNPPGIDTAR